MGKIDGEDAKGWTVEKAMSRLRGQKGTPVNIEIKRRGRDPIALTVTRDEVQLLTVPAAFMIDATTGYIRHSDWGENTDREMKRALADLRSKGMKRLVYDIRGNPGGPLDQAIKVSNEFLPKGKMIVYTEGRVSNSDQQYRGTDDGMTDFPMVVIANRSSASASEIFAGAMQDHDRAYLVGETTFGKALVQSVYRIAGNAGLALTTAHYFTPSGRLIQRPWDTTFDEYLSYTQKDQEEKKTHNPSDLKRTTAGRPVYSGGGVEPDKYIPGQIEGFNPTTFGRMLYSRQEFETFSQRFVGEGDTRIAPGPNDRVLPRNFTITDEMVQEFRKQLEDEKLKIDEAAWTKDVLFIRSMIRFRIDEALFGIADARRHLVAVDPQAQGAIQSFPEAEKLAGLTGSANRGQ
jgi:carboxyl-terminal processing protease